MQIPRRISRIFSTAAKFTAVACAFCASPTFAVDKNLNDYSKISGITGNLYSVGSDTLGNMMNLWGEDFKRHYPQVVFQMQAAGSSTAPSALTESTSNFGPMSRPMKHKELQAFEKRHGYKPTAIRVAVDALALFTHIDNPLRALSIAQVDAIYSSTRRCGIKFDIDRWGQLGLTGQWAFKDIQLYGRNSVSGTYGYFKKKALCRGDFRNTVNEQPGSASVVQSVSSSVNSIGYSGLGYKTSGVKTISISQDGSEYIEATMENALNGSYPFARFLYVYVNKHPNRDLEPSVAEFVRFILSKEGQQVVESESYIPVPAYIAKQELDTLDLVDK